MGSLKAYEQRLSRHEEDSIKNAFQSKLSLRSQNQDDRAKKNGENFGSVENSRSFSKTYQDKYPPCGICKRRSHWEKDC